MTNPLPGMFMTYRHNRTLHGRSVYRRRDVRGHNCIRWSILSDAIDAFCPAGTVVRAMHAGEITRIADPHGRLGCVYVDGPVYKSTYAHMNIKAGLGVGDMVTEGQVLGYVGRILSDPHLHYELLIRNKAVSGRTAKALAEELDKIISS